MICENSHQLPKALVLAIGLAASAAIRAQTSGTWHKTGSMNTARYYHAAVLLTNGQVLVAGGGNNSGTTLTSAELYDPLKAKWTVTGSMSIARATPTVTLLQNGQVLVTGGGGGANTELYNPSTGTWTLTGSMTTARNHHTATLLQNGQVLVAGGVTTVNGSYLTLSSAELYNPSTGTWTATGSMNEANSDFTATLLPNGQVLAAGAFSNANAELYNPATGTWTLTGAMVFAPYDQFAMLLSTGDALVLDGIAVQGKIAYAELYNPATGTWIYDSGNGKPGNTGQTVTLLGTQMVLSCGGTSGGYPTKTNILASCDLFDPSAQNDSVTGSMTIPRHRHTATVLQNGQVLAAGGEMESNVGKFSITASAELYTP